MSNNITPETLIRYLDNELEPDDRLYVEAQLLSDPALRAELDRLQLAKQAIVQYARRQHVGSIHKEMMVERQPKVTRVRWMRVSLRIAAVLLVALLAAGIVQYTQLDAGKLYNAQYEAYSLRVTRDSDEVISRLEEYYRTGRMKDVIAQYEDPSLTHLPSDHFLAGQAYLSQNDPQKAITAFEAQLAANKLLTIKPYQDDSEYYMALAYLKAGDVSEAIPLFRRIHDTPSHAYHKEVSSWYLRKLQWLEWKSK
jgi:tetratricopeptide (TPR) repeat protein